jgi:hypothetical protein
VGNKDKARGATGGRETPMTKKRNKWIWRREEETCNSRTIDDWLTEPNKVQNLLKKRKEKEIGTCLNS